MWYRSLELWHWIAIGLVVGLLVGASRVMSDEEPLLGGPGFISQYQFEKAILTPPVDGKPYLRDIVVRPSKSVSDVDVVTLSALDRESNSYRLYLFAAPRPFVRQGEIASSANFSVEAYLRTLAVTNPSLKPQFAWWDTPVSVFAFYGLLGIALIGGIWPAALRLTGGPASIDPAYDLDRFHHQADSRPTAVPASDADFHLEDLDHELEQAVNSPDRIERSPDSPVRSLESGLYVPVTSLHEQEKKDFAGEYYPVEKHSPRGFTLVELIIVIGIIALLMSFLMPSIRIARQNAQTVKCAAQLNQIGAALHAYASANHDWFPAWSGWHTWPTSFDTDSSSPAWTVEMIPYLGNPDSPVYNCPAFQRPDRYRNYFLESQWAGRSGKNAMKTSAITRSSQFVLSGDKTATALYPGDVRADDTDPDDYSAFGGGGALLWPWNGGFYMHRTGNNVLFEDGHVAIYTRFDPHEMTFHPRLMQDHEHVTPD
jgi:prepilin-type N-terminal cleavage/methylation domain-containing protein